MRSFHFHPLTLTVAFTIFLAAMIWLAVYAFHAYRTRGLFADQSAELETLRAAKTALEAQVDGFAETVDALNAKVSRIHELDAERGFLTDEVKNQLGLPPETPFGDMLPKLASAVAWAGPPEGVGGPESAAGGWRDLTRNLNRDLDRLMMEADNTANYLTIFNDSLAGAASILAATPTVMPLSQGSISSQFGSRRSPFGARTIDMHRGLDIPVPNGTLVHAPADGVVMAFGQSGGGYGLLLTIDHGYGLVTRYGHLESTLVEAGQTVTRGQPVAKSGNSGRSTGPHLHYEVVMGGVPIDPLKLLAAVSPAAFKEVTILKETYDRPAAAPAAGQ